VSLLGALSLGGSSLAAQQTGLQVTGNNIANAGTDGYTRETVRLTPGGPQRLAAGQFLGTGVTVSAIERQANDAINESLRDATSSQTGAQTLNSLLSRLETTFDALGDNDLSTRLNTFFNGFSTLANNPGDTAQRSVVVQNGVSLAGYLQNLRGQLTAIRADAQTQVTAQVTQADTLAKTIATLNGQIATVEGGGGGANTLRDQRDQALMQLSQIMDVRTLDQGNGVVNVLVGSMPLVQGTTTRGVSSVQITDPTTGTSNTKVVFADNNDGMDVTGGKLGALITARDAYLTPAVTAVDDVAAGLISAVNAIHSQGQGLAGFSAVTAAAGVTDPAAALNTKAAGLAFPPANGTFNLYLKDATTGQVTTRQITVNLSGQGTQTTLASLAAGISAAGGGTVTATVNAANRLVIASGNPNVTFGFGEDTSGALASVGVNTFFTGTDAASIGVNAVLTKDPAMLAAGRGNTAGSNANALALSLAGGAAVSRLGGKSLTDYYAHYIGTLSAHAKNAADDVTARAAIHDTLFAQQQAISGVSLDEEAINLTKYQRAFQGTARFMNVVDDLMQTVLSLVH
jgi:flagellar hook-associated protein 1 FlgK